MNLTAKEYLRNIRHLGLILRTKADSMAWVRDLGERITGRPNGVHVQMDPAYSRVEHAAVALADMYDDVAQSVRAYADKRREALAFIERLTDARHRAVLELRYVSCHSWPEVVDIMSYEGSWVHRLHGEALRELDKTRTTSEF